MSPAPFYDDGTVTIWCADVRDAPSRSWRGRRRVW
jgi:hypothetical protein